MLEVRSQTTVPAKRGARKARDTAELSAEAKYRLLLEISQKISGTLDLDEILEHLLDAVRSVVEYDAAGIFVLNRADVYPRHGHLQDLIAGMATRGYDPLPPQSDPMRRLGKGIVGHVISSGECVVTPDVRRDPRYVAGRRRTLAEIAVPILIGNRPIGALNLESNCLGAFAASDAEVLRFFANAAAISIEKAILHRELLEKRRIEDQLRIAHQVQAGLLPGGAPDVSGCDIAGISLPSYQIGGDYFDYIRLPQDRLGAVVADVSGKGMPAALIMTTFRALLRSCAQSEPDVSRMAHALNRLARESLALLRESMGLPAFVTSVYGVLDPATGRFQYANCGHSPAILIRKDGKVEKLESDGPPLGLFDDARYQPGEIVLARGDLLLLYTDGVVETARADDTEFGLERLATLACDSRHMSADAVVSEIVRAAREFSGLATFDDDFTLLAIRRQ